MAGSTENRRAGKGGVVLPEEYRFRPGQSGNPGGRPKWKPFSDAYRELGKLPFEKLKTHKPKNGFEAVAKGMLLAAAGGRSQPAQEVADRVEGKVPTESKVDATVREAPSASTIAEILNMIAEHEGKGGK